MKKVLYPRGLVLEFLRVERLPHVQVDKPCNYYFITYFGVDLAHKEIFCVKHG